jgi:uncharacterized membrane protein (DUF485 family)
MVGGSGPSPRGRATGYDRLRYVAIRQDERFVLLKVKFRRFVLPVVIVFLGWYFLYVMLSAFGRAFMDQRIAGNINVAFVFGVLQFVSTFVFARCFARYARSSLDPLAEAIRIDADRIVSEHVGPPEGRLLPRPRHAGAPAERERAEPPRHELSEPARRPAVEPSRARAVEPSRAPALEGPRNEPRSQPKNEPEPRRLTRYPETGGR